MNIGGRTFLITGGSSGLGAATAMHLVKLDANVLIMDIDREWGKTLIEKINGRACFVYTDIANSKGIETAIAKAIAHFGAFHGLINCAGILGAERMVKKDGHLFDLDRFRDCIEINLIGSFNTARLVLPTLRVNKPDENGERGVIINTASIAAYEGQIGQVAYAASKAGIIGMTLPMARELGRYGIRVATIAPGVFETPLFSQLSDEKHQALENNIPFPKRFGKPAEYASTVQHIIENPMINGETIRLDGGLRLGIS